MAVTGHVVFMRAANVGGHNVFRPAQLAAALAHLDVVNVGAAGTLLVRGRSTPGAVAREVRAHMAFEPELIVRPAREILALVRSDPFAGVRFPNGVRGWVAALDSAPSKRPALPLTRPQGRPWSVRIERTTGAFALGTYRRTPAGSVFPSAVVESALGVRATTRWWETFVRVAELIEAGP
ncbi:MAG TPA: DUF1697 domain-containing protein [Candidatus Eisenbacteria bacterium]|nr:DUF1697 domain-containing protein [Candidatus Eisenbacteria bacterium]